MLVEELHQGHKACLRDLQFHGFALDGLDFGVRGFLFRGREGVDVVEDVGAFVDGQGGAHFAEHVVLGFAFGLLLDRGLVIWYVDEAGMEIRERSLSFPLLEPD